MKVLTILLLVFTSVVARASISAPRGRYKVFALLSISKEYPAQIFVNPMTRSKYVMRIQNPALVIKQMNLTDYFGQVEVEFELTDGDTILGQIRVIKIKPVTLSVMPHYQGAFVLLKE